MVSEGMMHPEGAHLEAYADGTLEPPDAAVVDSHLLGCARCRAEVAEWRALFSALESLPRLHPSPGFAARVMAGVRVRRPLALRAGGWAAALGRRLESLRPRTASGWALVAALVALPMLSTGGAMAWLFTRPGLTPQALWLFLSDRLWNGVVSATLWAGGMLARTEAGAQVMRLFEAVAGVDAGQIGLAASGLAALTVASAWILYSNLIRPSKGQREYVSYSF